MSIPVLLVDDSPVALAVLKKMLAVAPDIHVVGTATNGKDALELIPRLRPAVICTDLVMPVMDGLQFTREVMARFPTPILVISSTINPEERSRSYPILEAGAIDVFPKPVVGDQKDLATLGRELASKLKILSGVHVFRRGPAEPAPPAPAPTSRADAPAAASRPASGSAPESGAEGAGGAGPVRMVGIGASTGGPIVLRDILEALPATFPAPITCVQHISDGFLSGFVRWLDESCPLRVVIAKTGEVPARGNVYFPPEGAHLEIDPGGRLVASQAPPIEGHRPSATVLLRSVAQRFGSGAVGVLLTGMGRDGAEGMVEITRRGGLTIAQNESTCAVFGMPKAAIELKAARLILSPDQIARRLNLLRGPTDEIK